MIEIITRIKPKNNKASLEWSLSNSKYLEIEDEFNAKVADDMTRRSHEMAARIKELAQESSRAAIDAGPQHQLAEIKHTNMDSSSHEHINSAKERERKIIPADRFEEYWTEREAVYRDLDKYRKLSYLYSGIEHRIVYSYFHSVKSFLEHIYGSPLPVRKYNIEHYNVLLDIYEKHKDEYGLAFPSFPEEHFVKKTVPDNE